MAQPMPSITLIIIIKSRSDSKKYEKEVRDSKIDPSKKIFFAPNLSASLPIANGMNIYTIELAPPIIPAVILLAPNWKALYGKYMASETTVTSDRKERTLSFSMVYINSSLDKHCFCLIFYDSCLVDVVYRSLDYSKRISPSADRLGTLVLWAYILSDQTLQRDHLFRANIL